MENLIFKKPDFEIFWYVGDSPINGKAKGVKIKCKAVNPNDKKEYEKYAGWIGVSLALHSGAKTPLYIESKATESIQKYKEEILTAIISFLEKIGEDYRANEFRKEQAKAAGKGINYKIAHPLGEGQRQKVRTMMQKNAPKRTNHL